MRISHGLRASLAAQTGPTDPDFANVSLLLHMDGSNGSTTFTDSSSNAVTVTAQGDAQISTAQSKFGGASGLFDGNGDYLSIPSSSDFDFGTGDFTVEAWVLRTSGVTFNLFTSVNVGGFEFYMDLFGGWSVARPGQSLDYQSGASLTSNVWSHVALCRDATSIRVFVNGVISPTTQSNSISYNASSGGSTVTSSQRSLTGYIDDLRITKGVARYTTSFTPPTAPFPDS